MENLQKLTHANTTITIILAGIAVAAIIVVGVFLLLRHRHSERLRKQFGSEYRHAVRQYGDEGKAEAELTARQERVHKLEIRALAPQEQGHFADAWRKMQARFVDEPSKAVGAADELIKEVMHTRGYPVGDFDQRAADISVDHPNLVKNYRAGREIMVRNKSGDATTEDLRQAMMRYRSLFEELVETEPATNKEAIR